MRCWASGVNIYEQRHQHTASSAGGEVMHLHYATSRIIELERLLLVDVPETVWPAEVGMVYS